MIPKELHPFFWDVNADSFDPFSYREYTIARLLEYGDEKAVAWLRTNFSEAEIAQVIRTEGRLTPKSANFWALVYRIPSSEVAALHLGRRRSIDLGFFSTQAFDEEDHLGKFQETPLADPRDIACMKISALAARGTRRDFVDVYVAARRYGLGDLLSMFRQKFAQSNYSMVHVLKSLTYFEEAEKDPMPDMLVALSWEEVKQFFTQEAPRLFDTEG